MNIVVDALLTFPTEDSESFNIILNYFSCIEEFEESFGIEFSCGDEKFFTDFYSWTPSGDGLYANVSDEILLHYDGKICLKTPPRFLETKKLLKSKKPYRFSIKHSERTEEAVFFLNNKEISRKNISL